MITETELMAVLNLSDKEWDALSDNVRAIFSDCFEERAELRYNLASMVRAFSGKYPIKSDKGFTLNLARAMLGRVQP